MLCVATCWASGVAWKLRRASTSTGHFSILVTGRWRWSRASLSWRCAFGSRSVHRAWLSFSHARARSSASASVLWRPQAASVRSASAADLYSASTAPGGVGRASSTGSARTPNASVALSICAATVTSVGYGSTGLAGVCAACPCSHSGGAVGCRHRVRHFSSLVLGFPPSLPHAASVSAMSFQN